MERRVGRFTGLGHVAATSREREAAPVPALSRLFFNKISFSWSAMIAERNRATGSSHDGQPSGDEMRFTKRASVVAALLAIIALASPAQAATKITFLYTAVNAFIGIFVAKDQGFLDKHGLDVDLSLAQNGSVISAALVADSAQIGGPTPTVLLQANEQGLDLVVVAGTGNYPLQTQNGIIARADSGIRTAQDLVGKKVGVPGLGGIIDVLSKKWVQTNGVDFHRVGWIELQFPQMGDALKTGLTDAIASVDPFYTRVLDSKVGYAIGDYANVIPPGTVPVVYASTRSWATKNAAAVKEFRAALKEAEAFIRDSANLPAARESLAKYTKLPPQVAATLAIPDRLDVDPTPESLSFWICVSREQGLIKGTPDPTTLVAP
jgi:NitT/TauT family transport system substrate-binding protein